MEPIRSVQNLVLAGVSHVPSTYIQPADSRPTNRSGLSLPLIDLSKPDDAKDKIKRAGSEWGGFYVTNHGIPLQLLRDIRLATYRFFEDLPMSEKLKYAGSDLDSFSEGYGSMMRSAKDGTTKVHWRDYFNHYTFPLSRRNPENWPEFYRQNLCHYSDEIYLLAERLLGLISESLGLKKNRIKECLGELEQNVATNYYPPCPQPELTLGVTAHTDRGVIAFLIEDDVGGLQVLKDDEWLTVQPLDDAIVVILSDQLKIVTNGEYNCVQHRAITNTSRPRVSVVAFFEPAKTMKVSPLPELVSESSPARYRGCVFGEYVPFWGKKEPDGK